ncbi:MAG: hypothetical protein JWN93_2212 [Hyphomicrobiales bacterium]|jgi:hypothetical protein|nr:hypothetical protein [Hyphomicrobiales bacterium]
MPVSRASVPTTSAAKYMIQLCKHWGHRLAVDYNETTGKVVFDDDRKCVFHATPETLELEIETADEEQLARTQNTVVVHLNRFAFREPFENVEWRRLQ